MKVHVGYRFGEMTRVGNLTIGDAFDDGGYLYGIVDKDHESISLVTLDGEGSTHNGPLTISSESQLMVRPYLGFEDDVYLEVTNG